MPISLPSTGTIRKKVRASVYSNNTRIQKISNAQFFPHSASKLVGDKRKGHDVNLNSKLLKS